VLPCHRSNHKTSLCKSLSLYNPYFYLCRCTITIR
jgi:hypothetical protein